MAITKIELSKNKHKLGAFALLIIGLIITIVVINLNQEKEEEYDHFVVTSYLDSDEYTAIGYIESQDETSYHIKSDELTKLKSILVKVGDPVEKGAPLVTYLTSTLMVDEQKTEAVKASLPGIVNKVTDSEIILTTGYEIKTSTDKVLGENQCVIITRSGGYDYATIETTELVDGLAKFELKFNTTSSDMESGETATIHVIDKVISDRNVCDIFSYKDDKVYGANKIIPVSYTIETEVIFIETVYKIDTVKEMADYLFNNVELLVKVGDAITPETVLAKQTYTHYVQTTESLLSEINGVITEVNNTDDEVKIEVFNTDRNYLEFEIKDKKVKSVSVDDKVLVKIGKDTIDSFISEINCVSGGYTGKITSPIFTKYNLGDDARITIAPSMNEYLLVPSDYIKNNHIKTIKGSKVISTLVTTAEYNGVYTIITSEFPLSTILESYNIKE